MIRLLQGCLFYGVVLGAIALAAGCASLNGPSEAGRYERLTQVPPGPNGSLFEVMSTVATTFDHDWETTAALAAHKGCRTNAVFDKYHLKHLYEQLEARLAELGVDLLHENGYIFVGVPMAGEMPDSSALTHLGTVLSGKERIHLFIPQKSPFGYTVDRQALRDIRTKLAKTGVGKDHVLLLPTDSFGLPSAMNETAKSRVMPVKICHS